MQVSVDLCFSAAILQSISGNAVALLFTLLLMTCSSTQPYSACMQMLPLQTLQVPYVPCHAA